MLFSLNTFFKYFTAHCFASNDDCILNFLYNVLHIYIQRYRVNTSHVAWMVIFCPIDWLVLAHLHERVMCGIAMVSESMWRIGTKPGRNVHWMVLFFFFICWLEEEFEDTKRVIRIRCTQWNKSPKVSKRMCLNYVLLICLLSGFLNAFFKKIHVGNTRHIIM